MTLEAQQALADNIWIVFVVGGLMIAAIVAGLKLRKRCSKCGKFALKARYSGCQSGLSQNVTTTWVCSACGHKDREGTTTV